MTNYSHTSKRKMCVVTVNIPENCLDVIDKYMTNKDYGFYCSRSEFIRIAVVNQLRKDFEGMEQIAHRIEQCEDQDSNLVRVPIGDPDENGIIECKTYKIVRRLEY